MHRILLAASAALVLGWAGQAAAAPVGHVGADYSRADLSLGSGDANADVWTGSGSVVFPATASLNVALDGAVQNFRADGESTTTENGTAHADFHVGDNALAGGFVGFENSDNVTLWGAGIEGQYTGQMGGVVGQVGYGTSSDLNDADFWGERVEGRFYGNDNLRFAGHVGALQISGDGDSTNLWNAGVDAEYQFASVPVSVWGGYERSSWDDLDLTADVFSVGVRYNFGGSLRDRDVAGSTMGSFGQLFGGNMGSAVIGILGGAF